MAGITQAYTVAVGYRVDNLTLTPTVRLPPSSFSPAPSPAIPPTLPSTHSSARKHGCHTLAAPYASEVCACVHINCLRMFYWGFGLHVIIWVWGYT